VTVVPVTLRLRERGEVPTEVDPTLRTRRASC
jgi:hypothetical protein